MPKVEILVAKITGRDNAKYVKGDVVEIDDELAKLFGKACKVLDGEEKPKRGRPKANKNED